MTASTSRLVSSYFISSNVEALTLYPHFFSSYQRPDGFCNIHRHFNPLPHSYFSPSVNESFPRIFPYSSAVMNLRIQSSDLVRYVTVILEEKGRALFRVIGAISDLWTKGQ